MLPSILNNQTCFFTVTHISRPYGTKIIYGICLNNRAYYISKSPGVDDCEQLDSHPALANEVIVEICVILTEIENEHKKGSSLARINQQIFTIRGKMKALKFNTLH